MDAFVKFIDESGDQHWIRVRDVIRIVQYRPSQSRIHLRDGSTVHVPRNGDSILRAFEHAAMSPEEITS